MNNVKIEPMYCNTATARKLVGKGRTAFNEARKRGEIPPPAIGRAKGAMYSIEALKRIGQASQTTKSS